MTEVEVITAQIYHQVLRSRLECQTWNILLPTIDRPDRSFNVYSTQRLDLFARCVRLSRLLVGFRTHFKSLHFHLHHLSTSTVH